LPTERQYIDLPSVLVENEIEAAYLRWEELENMKS